MTGKLTRSADPGGSGGELAGADGAALRGPVPTAARAREFVSNRARAVFGARYWLVGYPKCGNTWFGLMLRKALVEAYALPDEHIPDILTEWRFRRNHGVPAYGMTHQMPHFNLETAAEMKLDLAPFRDRKVVLLIRDPADVLVSLYMHNAYRDQPPLYSGSVDSMVHDEVYGLQKFIRYYQAWYDSRRLPREMLLVRYRDLWEAPAETVEKALRFLDIPHVGESLVRDVVEYGDFSNMRRLEKTNALPLKSMRASGREDPRSFKVRRGGPGDHRNHLSAETVSYIRAETGRKLPAFFGY